jgi:hypothetical protein
MGVDFIRRAAPTFRKSWNQGKLELAIPNLFTRLPGAQRRSVTAECSDINQIACGLPVTVVADGDSLVTLNGTRAVGRVRSAPPDVMRRIADAGGIAVGTIGEIRPVSETFDVELP